MVSHDIQAATRYASHILHLGEDRQLFYGSREDYRHSAAYHSFMDGDKAVHIWKKAAAQASGASQASGAAQAEAGKQAAPARSSGTPAAAKTQYAAARSSGTSEGARQQEAPAQQEGSTPQEKR